MTRRLRALAVAVAGTVGVFGASFGVLELGLQSPSAGERTAVRVLAELRRTRGVHAVLEVNGRRLLSTCQSDRGRDLLQLSDGTRLLVVGVHAYRTLPSRGSLIGAVSDRPALSVARFRARLVGAQAAVAGSHAFWERVLAARLEQANVVVRTVRFGSNSGYELTLSANPQLELIVDRVTLRPLAAVYRSRAVDASSRLVASGRTVDGC